ncbi:MAG: redoxin domain-containing protein [Rhodocyclaceae bacterium]|nr:redoxin domain-containing protein [Rhodocyclaceae bacterium]
MLSDDAVTADALSAAKPSRWRRLLSWELAAFLVLFVGLQFWQAREMATGAMPAFAGRLANGDAASLAGALKQAGGGPLLVYVWSSWCPVCRIEEGSIKSLADDWPVLTVAMQSGDAGAVARFMAQRATVYPALVDEHGEIAWRLGVRGVPAWFVVDDRGLIRFSGSGYTTSWGLRLRLWWARAVAA